ncbi:hypothetical protein B277_03490 [Janibacter hoylei PVAS-1]|uniref:Uncharacterized protein n=2 Tax=Janibacter hoylei PVAS-1 TaxID=1210046 RepID=K1E079_9MICO|nr:SIR2 family protein [Janibacter hoylei]EKA62084.1 hypothetical protein B277_03490 [Janibacter hoylei PVAS-1]
MTPDRPERLARDMHAGQRDKLGRDYVTRHLRPVVDKLKDKGDHAIMGGWLHDIIVTDTKTTLAELLDRNFPPEVVRAVDSVTKRPGEFYEDLITRASVDELGRQIKLADIEVNTESNPALAKKDPAKAKQLLEKYERARRQLGHHPSHLFVVHGRIEHLTHDVAIIPTDVDVTVEPHWDAASPEADAKPARLNEGWARWGESSCWFVDVASGDVDAVLRRVRAALYDIAQTHPWRVLTPGSLEAQGTPQGRRPLPLIAMPVLGIGQGGRGDQQGEVIEHLIRGLTETLKNLPFDIALVTPDPAVYAAAQHARVRAASDHPLAGKAKDLASKARAGELALFLGAGVSIPAGLPTWHELIVQLGKSLDPGDREVLDGLDITDRAQLIQQLKPHGFQQSVADITSEVTRPSLVHTLLAGLDVANVVTTNYDALFESAMRAAGHAADVVLPHTSAIGQRRWVLKMHGDVDHPATIVLTRRHMVRYDAANRPSAALLQSLLLTKHLMVVGASMTDPNVLRLIHEVDAYRDEHGQARDGDYGTVLDAGPTSPGQTRLWEGQLDWVDLTRQGIGSGPRTLEILLDLVGVFASRDSSWVLDERFGSLLEPSDREFAERLRQIAVDTPSGETWAPLRRVLDELGIKQAESPRGKCGAAAHVGDCPSRRGEPRRYGHGGATGRGQ